MKHIRKKFLIGFSLISLSTATWLWLRAQDAPVSSGDSTVSADKWEQVKKNNDDMVKSLETIEQNLQFIKARAMSGGRHS